MVTIQITAHDTKTLLAWVRKQTNVPIEVLRLMDDISEAHMEYLDMLHEKLRMEYMEEVPDDMQ